MRPDALLAVLLCNVAHPGNLEAQPQFDVAGFAADCAAHVPDVATALAMDSLCIGTGHRLCAAAHGQKGLSQCQKDISSWMIHDTDMLGSGLSAEALNALSDFSVTTYLQKTLTDDQQEVLPLTYLCDQAHIPYVQTEVVCAYQDALRAWLATRALWRIEAGLKTTQGDIGRGSNK